MKQSPHVRPRTKTATAPPAMIPASVAVENIGEAMDMAWTEAEGSAVVPDIMGDGAGIVVTWVESDVDIMDVMLMPSIDMADIMESMLEYDDKLDMYETRAGSALAGGVVVTVTCTVAVCV
jgi:hypothetical protein